MTSSTATTLEIRDLADGSQVQLSLIRGQDRDSAPPADFTYPLEDRDLQEICWYFTEFLQHPFGESKPRADSVEARLRSLGQSLFQPVFQGNDEAGRIYAAASQGGLAACQLLIVSGRPEFLGLPWELMNSTGDGFLALQFASVVRRSSAVDIPKFDVDLDNQQFNVLLVSPAPWTKPADASSTTSSVAIEMLEALESLDVVVELDRLQPAGLQALSQRLEERPGHYHAVHLDDWSLNGDGGFNLESGGKGSAPVSVAQVADLLVKASVPMVVLNGQGLASPNSIQAWSRAATALSQAGVPFVVSLPTALTGRARADFVRNLYVGIVRGGGVAEAIASTRRALMDDPQRPSLAGKAVFWDWAAPTVYQSKEYTPIAIEVDQPDPLAAPMQPEQHTGPDEQLPRNGSFGLVGRRGELRELEAMFREQPVVLMSGNAGSGKTELALGMARWLQKTAARTGGVFYTTFQVGAGLERVVHEIGTAVAGLNFADMPGSQQRQWVLEYLQHQPSLLVWDGVQQTVGLLEESEQADLNAFVAEATQGSISRALLVSRRRNEPWLTTPHLDYELPALGANDRAELASLILQERGPANLTPGGDADHQLGPAYVELLDLIEGNPLAMHVAIPMLKEVPASVLLGELQSRSRDLETSSQQTGQEPDRDPYLTALMEYSFSRMPRRSRAHLPFLSMFQQRVMMDILTHITQERPYRTTMGEELGWGACRTLLRSARDAGFLESINPSVYQIHPALPWFYGRRLTEQMPASGIRELEREFVRVYADTADYFMETLYENQDSGTTAVLAEEGNLTQALGLALEDDQWDAAQLLIQPLAQVYRMQKRYPELQRLRRQLLQVVNPDGGGAAEAEPKGAIELWLYLMGTEASEATDRLDFRTAQELNRELLAYLSSTPEGEQDPRTAAVYHQMGVLEQHRWNLVEAEELFGQSLAIIEQGEDEASVADDYYGIGQVKHHQRLYTEAKEWFSKSLAIHQRLEDGEEMVKDFRALGLAAQYKFEYDEAESWYQRAQSIVEDNRDEEVAAQVYHELGTVFHARYMFEEAEDRYRQALALAHRLGLDAQMAMEFHYLGLLAQARGVGADVAEEWFELALEKREELGDMRGVGDECRQLGVSCHQDNRLEDAQRWYQRALDAFEEIRDVDRTARTCGQLGRLAEEQGDLANALEWVARTYRLAAEHQLPALAQAKAHLAALREQYGDENFTSWWRGFAGTDPPEDLGVDPDAAP